MPDIDDPTPEEARNGWTRESLAAYRRQRADEEAMALDPMMRKKPKPKRTARYNPLKWRRR